MKDETQTSSVNLLLIISAVILVGLGATWWGYDYFGKQEQPPEPIVAVVDRTPVITETPLEAVTGDTVDTHLGKAQLAIEANMVFEPAGQNALYFIGLVLGETPDHGRANDALDSILDSLTESVQQAIEADDYVRGYKIAQMVDGLRPNHPLVLKVRDALQERTDGLFAAASAYANSGERGEAFATISEIGNLPGVDADRLQAMRSEVELHLSEFEAAAVADQQRSREETARANASSKLLSDADAALADGRFLEPAEDNAAYYLSRIESDSPEDATAFKERMHDTVLASAELAIGEGQFDEVDELLTTAAELGVSAERINASRNALNVAYANNEAKKVIPTQKLIWKERVAPVYPRSAQRRGTEGQVEIAFTVTTSGETSDVVIVKSDPGETFDRAAIQAVQQWQFEPHTIRGIPVNQRSGALLYFSLN